MTMNSDTIEKNMPLDLSKLIQDFARPISRPDWRNGSMHKTALITSKEYYEFKEEGLFWCCPALQLTSGSNNISEVEKCGTFAYEWANDRWFKNNIHTNMTQILGHIISNNRNDMKWFWIFDEFSIDNNLNFNFNDNLW